MTCAGEIKVHDHIYSVSLMIRCMLSAWNIDSNAQFFITFYNFSDISYEQLLYIKDTQFNLTKKMHSLHFYQNVWWWRGRLTPEIYKPWFSLLETQKLRILLLIRLKYIIKTIFRYLVSY